MRLDQIIVCVAIALLVPDVTIAQPKPMPAKGQVVTIKIPIAAFDYGGSSVWTGTPPFVANVTANGAMVNGTLDWAMEGFPSLWEAKVNKINKRNDGTEIELQSTTSRSTIKLRFVGVSDVAGTFENLTIPLVPRAAPPLTCTARKFR